MQKVSLVTNFNLYESKRYFTEKLRAAMQRYGLETQLLDVKGDAFTRSLIESLKAFNPDFICSFHSNVPSDGKFYWDLLNIPHVSFLVDPSFYSTSLTESPLSIISCVDRKDCAALIESGFENAFFWPHAVERELNFDPHTKRIYDVVLVGSCQDYESLRQDWQQKYSVAVNKLLDNAIDMVFSHETLSLGEALVAAWSVSQINPAEVNFLQLYYYLDCYTRGKDRVELVRSIKDAHVHVFGALATEDEAAVLDWKDYLGEQANVTVHPPVKFEESMHILKQAKIALNSMPFFRDGSHERIFTAFATGCLPISSESIYLREQFQEGKEISFYSAKNRPAVNQLVNEWLSNEPRRAEAVYKGREKVMRLHTWDQRVQELLEQVNL